MITVRLDPGKLTVSRHAGYALAGQDIVCTAVSTVVVMCKETMRRCGCTWIGRDDGETVTIVVDKGVGRLVLQAAGKVLQDLAQQYPENVKTELTWR